MTTTLQQNSDLTPLARLELLAGEFHILATSPLPLEMNPAVFLIWEDVVRNALAEVKPEALADKVLPQPVVALTEKERDHVLSLLDDLEQWGDEGGLARARARQLKDVLKGEYEWPMA